MCIPDFSLKCHNVAIEVTAPTVVCPPLMEVVGHREMLVAIHDGQVRPLCCVLIDGCLQVRWFPPEGPHPGRVVGTNAGQLGAALVVLIAPANLDAVVPRTDLLSTRILMAAWLAAFTVSHGTSSALELTSCPLLYGSWDGEKTAALAPCPILPVAAAPNTWWRLLCPWAPWGLRWQRRAMPWCRLLVSIWSLGC